MRKQKDELERINVESVLDSLNENISEASPLNFFRRFFKSGGSTPAPRTIDERAYIQNLDRILRQIQQELNQFVNRLDLRAPKRGMASINFVHHIHAKKRKPVEPPPLKLGDPTHPGIPTDFSKHERPPDKPPINTIFEADLRAWRKRSTDLGNLMTAFASNIQNYLQDIAKDIGYAPMKTDLVGMIHEFNKYPNLSRRTKYIIKTKLQHFLNNYEVLKSWYDLFKRTEGSIEKYQKKNKMP